MVAEPVFLMWPSMKVDLPPERLVDSLIATSDMGKDDAWESSGRMTPGATPR